VTSELIVPETDPIVQYISELAQTTHEWVEYAAQAVQNGNSEEATKALTVVHDQLMELISHSETTSRIVGGMAQTIKDDAKKIIALEEELELSDEKFEERAMQLAQAMTESELDYILEDNEQLEEERIRHIAHKMIEDGSIDYVKEQELKEFQRTLREAEDLALHELTYGDPNEPYMADEEEPDLVDETEEA